MFDVAKQIKTVDDVKAFFDHLVKVEKLNFHPDDTFDDYQNFETGEPSYSEQEAKVRDQRMNEAFDVCEYEGADIYQLAYDAISATF